MRPNSEVNGVQTDALKADELCSWVEKHKTHGSSDELGVGDGWIALSLAKESGLVLSLGAEVRPSPFGPQ